MRKTVYNTQDIPVDVGNGKFVDGRVWTSVDDSKEVQDATKQGWLLVGKDAELAEGNAQAKKASAETVAANEKGDEETRPKRGRVRNTDSDATESAQAPGTTQDVDREKR